MKKIVFLLLGVLISSLIFAQDIQDVIYLKNGSTIKGTIIKQEPNQEIIIKTNDGFLYSFKSIEVEQILKNNYLILEEYGGKFSSGLAIGGGGLIGYPVSFHTSSKFAFEIGLHYRPLFLNVEDYWGRTSSSLEHSVLLSLGTNFYLGKSFKEKKQKIKLNGITVKGGAGFGSFNTTFFAVGWINESFKKKNKKKSFSLELGPGLLYTYCGNKHVEDLSFMVYWKFQWNWYRK